MHQKHRNFKHSIFTKLVLILLFSGFIVNFILIGGFRKHFGKHNVRFFKKNIETYADLLIDKMGDPFDKNFAKQFSVNNQIFIYYRKNDEIWYSADKFPPKAAKYINKKIERTSRAGRYFITSKNVNGAYYLFLVDMQYKNISVPEFFLYFILPIIVVFIITYLFIRKILSPVNELSKGLREAAEGNLDYQVAVTTNDQLGYLSRSFNRMASKLKERKEARDQLLRDISHELRSPLTRIKIAMEFISADQNKTSIADDISEMEYLINEILEAERFNVSGFHPLIEKMNVNELLMTIKNKYHKTKPGIILKDINEERCILSDKKRLLKCLTNITENAQKYSAHQTKPVEITLAEESQYLNILIKDYGIGVAKEEIPLIFEPFYRTDKSRNKKIEGYGLGLTICKKIITALKGKIEIESELGKYTIVKLSLPYQRNERI
jgi:signal transduction histidine kinase